MPIDMSEETIEAHKMAKGDQNFTLSAGKVLKIESSPNGEEHLIPEIVPPGEEWDYMVFVKIKKRTV